jgi:hypothetical protein
MIIGCTAAFGKNPKQIKKSFLPALAALGYIGTTNSSNIDFSVPVIIFEKNVLRPSLQMPLDTIITFSHTIFEKINQMGCTKLIIQ